MKIKKKSRGRVGGGGGVRVDVNKEVKLYRGGPIGGRGGGWLVARLGVVGDVQYWGCKPRIEGIVNEAP